MKSFNFFDAIYYINLDHRTDRNVEFLKKSTEAGIDSPIRISGEWLPEDYSGPGHRNKIGCILSHQKTVQHAKDNNYNSILILEDDCVFVDEFQQELPMVLHELKHIDWSLLYIGGEPSSPCMQVSNNIYACVGTGFYCTHAYAVHRRFYDVILGFDAYGQAAIDIALMHYYGEHRPFHASKKMLVYQEPNNYSDIDRNDRKDARNVHYTAWDKYITNSVHNGEV